MKTTTQNIATVSYTKFKFAAYDLQCRYQMFVLKAAKAAGFTHVYFDGGQGQGLALILGQLAPSYEYAVMDLASQHNESEEDIKADYRNWYYILPIEEAIDNLESEIKR